MIKNNVFYKKIPLYLPSCLGQKAQAAAEMAILGSLILLCFSFLLTYGQRMEEQQRIKMEAFRNAMAKSYQRNAPVSYTLQRDTRFFNLLGGFGEGQNSSLSASSSVMWQKGSSGPHGNKDAQSYAYYQVNDQMIGEDNQFVVNGYTINDTILPQKDKTTIGLDGTSSKGKASVSVWRIDTNKNSRYSSTSRKQEENGGRIANNKSSDLQETSDVALYTRFDDSVTDARYGPGDRQCVGEGDTDCYRPPHYVDTESYAGQYGAYYNSANNRIEYSQSKVGNVVHKDRTWNTDY